MYKDFKANEDHVYRIFSYNIPRTSEFKLPGAMNSRGSMFYVNTNTNEATLLCLPMKKFFSLGETPESGKVDPSKAKRAFMKEDGSLLTSYISPVDGSLKFKSQKQPTFQEYDLVEKSISEDLAKEIKDLYTRGICVDMELTTPLNRVFLDYKTYTVHVLRARDLTTGESVDIRSPKFMDSYPEVTKHLVKEIDINEMDVNTKGIEGYVIEDHQGDLWKVKTIPYLSMSAVINIQDRSKENEYMYEAALNECLDDIKSLYHYRRHSPNFPLEEILRKLDETQEYAKRTYKDLAERVDKIYSEYKHLPRADFARAVKDNSDIMSLLMDKYLGKNIDIKKYALKLYGKTRS